MEDSKKDAVSGLLFLVGEINSFYEYLGGTSKVIEKMKKAGFSEGIIKEVEWGITSAKKEIGMLNSQLGFIKEQVRREKGDDLFNPFETLIS